MPALWMWYTVSVVPALFSLPQLIWPAVNRWIPATQNSVMALGLMMKPPWLCQFSLLTTLPSPNASFARDHHGYRTLYESVASNILKSVSLCSIFSLLGCESQLSVGCVTRRAAGDSPALCVAWKGHRERAGEGAGTRGRAHTSHRNSDVRRVYPESLGYIARWALLHAVLKLSRWGQYWPSNTAPT